MRSLHRMAALGMLMGEACREPRTLDPDTCVHVVDHYENLRGRTSTTMYPDKFKHPEIDVVFADIQERIADLTDENGFRPCYTPDFPAPHTVGAAGLTNDGKAIHVSLNPLGSHFTEGFAADSGISVNVSEHPRDCSENVESFFDYNPPSTYADAVEQAFKDAVHCATH